MTPQHHRQLERLVSLCARKAWVVAYGLLRDADEAFDAVQQAFVVAARKPDRIPTDDPWPWFGVVVAHEARNLRRKKRPWTNHEGAGGMNANGSDPQDAASRLEARDRLREAVDRLPGPERDAVTLTHLGGMTHRAAAQALGIPRQTVTLHVQRGLKKIGTALSEDRRDIARRLAAAPLFAMPVDFEAMKAHWAQAAAAALPAAATATATVATTTALGGLAMSSKLLWVLSISAALGVGALGGHALGRSASDGATEDTAHQERTTLPLRGNAPKLEPASATTDMRALQASIDDLRTRLAASNKRGEELAQRLAEAQARRPKSSGPLFTFGPVGKLAAIQEANWVDLAKSSQVVHDGILEVREHAKRGEKAPQAVYLRIQENVEAMRKYEYRTIGKIDTDAKHNGEYTHPLTVANLLGAALADASAPLTAAQIEKITALGTAYENDVASMRARWVDAPRVKRIFEEYRLKGRFVGELKAILDPKQRVAVYNERTEGIAGLDLHCPTLMILHTSPLLVGSDGASIGEKLQTMLIKKYRIAEAEHEALHAAVQAWMESTRGLIATPTPKPDLKHYTYAQGLEAGGATVALAERILAEVRLDDEGRNTLMGDFAIYVPRRIEADGM